MKKDINVYIVSDSSGEAALVSSNAALAQFAGINPKQYIWPMVRSREQVDLLFKDILERPGIIIYTMVDRKTRDYMKSLARKHSITCFSAISRIIDELVNYIGVESSVHISGSRHLGLDGNYFKKIDAINFTMQHDDGQNLWDIADADIIIIGISRTSKSPTSLFLSQMGFKVANIPFISEVPFPVKLEELKNVFIIGLVVSESVLVKIRDNRLKTIYKEPGGNKQYLDCIKQDIVMSKKFFMENRIPILDISNRAIEETAGEIINLYHVFCRRNT